MKFLTSILIWLFTLSTVNLAFAQSEMDSAGSESIEARPAMTDFEDASAELQALAKRGEELYWSPASCVVCHDDKAQGLIGPSLAFGPSPYDIHYQFISNPQMTPLRDILKPTNNDLLSISVYVATLTGTSLPKVELNRYKATLSSIRAPVIRKPIFSARDKLVEKIQAFQTVIDDWQRKAKTGSLKRDYKVDVAAEYDPGPVIFNPEPGKTYFYENTGTIGMHRRFAKKKSTPPKSTQIIVGDAETKQVIASYLLPENMRGAPHTTVMSPDGSYVYIIGSRPYSDRGQTARGVSTPASLLKADARTLRPIKQLVVGGRMHHGQTFQDKYLLIDTFISDADGLDVYLMDPETDEIIGGVRDADLGGNTYTAFNDGEYIYILMQPEGYGSTTQSAHRSYISGRNTMLRPYWVAKIDPVTWEVVREYPYPGFRGDWIVFDAKKEYMYIPVGSSDTLSKIELASGNVVWTGRTGTGPYGASLNADETEIWVADKGESTGQFGRTVSVFETKTGRQLETLFGGYQTDHILLAPNGKEFWSSSNGEGRLYVYDAKTREQTHTIDMPSFGDAHGIVWVHYDENGVGKVVRDQGGFANGINPALGKTLDYPVHPVNVATAPTNTVNAEDVSSEDKNWVDKIFGFVFD